MGKELLVAGGDSSVPQDASSSSGTYTGVKSLESSHFFAYFSHVIHLTICPLQEITILPISLEGNPPTLVADWEGIRQVRLFSPHYWPLGRLLAISRVSCSAIHPLLLE